MLALSELPNHPTLIHPVTGDPLRAIYQTKDGTYRWPVLGGADSESDDEDEDEEDDEDDDDTSGGSGSGGSEGTGEKGKTSEDDPAAGLKSALEKERERRKAARRERDELRGRLEQLENKDKPELEQITRERDTLKSENEALRETVTSGSRRLAFLSVAGLDWADPEDALAIAERRGLRDVEVDDDGEIDSSEVQRIAKELAENKPHLLRKQEGKKDDKGSGDGDPAAASGSTGKTKKDKAKDARFTDETLRSKFPALRR